MADAFPSGPQLFHCPTCGAALPLPADSVSVRCEYCGSSVLVPPEYRTHQEAQPEISYQAATIEHSAPVVIDLTSVTRGKKSAAAFSLIGRLVVIVFTCSIIGVVLAAAGVFQSTRLISASVKEVIALQTPEANPARVALTQVASAMPRLQATPTPDYEILLQFGAKGIGPGQLDDARYITVDPQGNIFTAEYQDGRVQKFGPDGKFVQLINVPADDQGYTTISDMVSDYAGKLYIARRGDILVYNTADGSPAGAIPGRFPDTWYESLAIDPANNLYALHIKAGELDLIKFDSNGQQLWRKVQVTQGLYKPSEISRIDRFTVDGLGDPYLLDDSQHEVYRFNSNAEFIDRFGGKGDLPGQFDSPNNILVDGQGQTYVGDSNAIHIFSSSTSFIKTIPDFWDGALRDLALDLQVNLYILSGESQVFKIHLK